MKGQAMPDVNQTAEEWCKNKFGSMKLAELMRETWISGASWQREQDQREIAELRGRVTELNVIATVNLEENARLREAVRAVVLDAVECEQAETKQYFISEWAMNNVRQALPPGANDE